MSSAAPIVPGDAPESAQRDPRAYLRVLWRWKLLFLVIAVSVPAAAMLLRSDPPAATYGSEVLMQVQPFA
ncbi:MAG: hypothetical protein WKF48_11895, partial [Solirubrobacteraceae bacterium]